MCRALRGVGDKRGAGRGSLTLRAQRQKDPNTKNLVLQDTSLSQWPPNFSIPVTAIRTQHDCLYENLHVRIKTKALQKADWWTMKLKMSMTRCPRSYVAAKRLSTRREKEVYQHWGCRRESSPPGRRIRAPNTLRNKSLPEMTPRDFINVSPDKATGRHPIMMMMMMVNTSSRFIGFD